MANPKALAEAWEKFERLCVTPGAGPIQRKVQKETFYCGAQAVLDLLCGIQGGPDITDDEILAVGKGIELELRAFEAQIDERTKSLLKRRAAETGSENN